MSVMLFSWSMQKCQNSTLTVTYPIISLEPGSAQSWQNCNRSHSLSLLFGRTEHGSRSLPKLRRRRVLMALTRKLTTKDGRTFYEISVSRGRRKSRLTRRWYPPDGWSRKAIKRELTSVAAEFERQSDTGRSSAAQSSGSGPRWRRRRPQKSSPSASMGNGCSCPPKLSL